MSLDTFDPKRDVTAEYIANVTRWIESTGEVFVVMRYLRGAKDYAFVLSPEAFHQLIDLCPTGTDIIVFKDHQLPMRGRVDDRFIADARSLIADGTEYLCVCLTPRTSGDPRLAGEMGDSCATMVEDLNDNRGEKVALGPCPRFIDPDNEDMISASKGGVDGPR